MTKTQAKQLVVCVNNEGYAASLETRKIYVALEDDDLKLTRFPHKPKRPPAGELPEAA